MSSGYVIASVTVTNPTQYEEYRKWSTLAMQAHGAEVCVRGGKVEVLEGDWNPGRTVILKFASFDAARYDGAETRGITLKIRGQEMTLDGEAFLNLYSMPQFHFHLTTAYNILRHNGVEVGKVVAVPDDSFRTTLRLSHTPTEKGIFSYSVRVEAVEGEVFTTNNDWPLEVAVTDDRTNVLLVDSVPRWEFRYLRNLFYGRDKSVHLQYVLNFHRHLQSR